MKFFNRGNSEVDPGVLQPALDPKTIGLDFVKPPSGYDFFNEIEEYTHISREGWKIFDDYVNYFTGAKYAGRVSEALQDIYGFNDKPDSGTSKLSLAAATKRFTRASAELKGASLRIAIQDFEERGVSSVYGNADLLTCADVVSGIQDNKLAALCERVGFASIFSSSKGDDKKAGFYNLTCSLVDFNEAINAERRIVSEFLMLLSRGDGELLKTLEGLQDPMNAGVRKVLLADIARGDGSRIKTTMNDLEDNAKHWISDYADTLFIDDYKDLNTIRVKALIDFALLSLITVSGVGIEGKELLAKLLVKNEKELPVDIVNGFAAFRRYKSKKTKDLIDKSLGYYANDITNSWRSPITRQDRQALVNLFNLTLSDKASIRRDVDNNLDLTNRRNGALTKKDFGKMLDENSIEAAPLMVAGMSRSGVVFDIDKIAKKLDESTLADMQKMIQFVAQEPYGEGTKKMAGGFVISIGKNYYPLRRFSPMEKNGFSKSSPEGRKYRLVYAVNADSNTVYVEGFYRHDEFDSIFKS